MHEIITLQIGQCGNQIGNDVWSHLCYEHGLTQDGFPVQITTDDRKNIFFYQSENGKYIPRCVLIDLEPRVIQNVQKNFFNSENIFVCGEGCGAGNNWAHGYFSGQRMKSDILDAIQKEAEACDYMESFFMFHSVAGGTGSGFGSLMLEELKSNFPKKIIQSYSIFPNNAETSDVVVQPYNSILALKKLYDFCDSVFVMDNAALGKIALNSLRIKTPNLDQINLFISTVINASTGTIRFPTYMFPDVSSILSVAIPYHTLKFLIPSYSPFLNSESKIVRKMTVDEIIRRNHSEKNRMASCEESKTHSYISVLNIINNVGNVDEIHKSLLKGSSVNFVPWMPPFSHVVMGKNLNGRMNGLCISNYTGISTLFKKICNQFDTLKSRNAYVEGYKKYCGDLGIFDEARETVQKIVEEYQSSELVSFRNK